MKHPCFNTSTGQIKICSLWQFLSEIKTTRLHPSVAEVYAMSQQREYASAMNRYSPVDQSGVYSRTEHILKLNPTSVLVDLKKTTSLKERRSKNVKLEYLLDELSIESLEQMGELTHMFPIGQNRYALISDKDVHLYVKEDFNQVLVCHAKNRNFQVYAPHLKVF